MTRKDENYLFHTLENIRDETYENNIMLKQICQVINYWLANANQENDNDFNKNVLANILSNIIEGGSFNRR